MYYLENLNKSEYEDIYVGATKGISIISKIIKMYQFGYPITHVFYVYPEYGFENPLILEAYRKGVKKQRLSAAHYKGTEFYIYSIKVKKGLRKKLENILESQIGKKYDFFGILGFVLRNKKFQRKNRQFCSELIYQSLKKIGIELLKNTDPAEVSPQLFVKSPYLNLKYKGILKEGLKPKQYEIL